MCKGNDNKSYIFGYTLTGIKFAKSKGNFYNNFIFTNNGNLIVEYLDNGYIDILNGSDLEYIFERKETITKSGIIYFDKNDSTFYMIFKTQKSEKNYVVTQNFNFDF